jgi:hypothetical protein
MLILARMKEAVDQRWGPSDTEQYSGKKGRTNDASPLQEGLSKYRRVKRLLTQPYWNP